MACHEAPGCGFLSIDQDEVDAREVVIATNREELVLLADSLNEALEAVEGWEFDTRLGDRRRRLGR